MSFWKRLFGALPEPDPRPLVVAADEDLPTGGITRPGMVDLTREDWNERVRAEQRARAIYPEAVECFVTGCLRYKDHPGRHTSVLTTLTIDEALEEADVIDSQEAAARFRAFLKRELPDIAPTEPTEGMNAVGNAHPDVPDHGTFVAPVTGFYKATFSQPESEEDHPDLPFGFADVVKDAAELVLRLTNLQSEVQIVLDVWEHQGHPGGGSFPTAILNLQRELDRSFQPTILSSDDENPGMSTDPVTILKAALAICQRQIAYDQELISEVWAGGPNRSDLLLQAERALTSLRVWTTVAEDKERQEPDPYGERRDIIVESLIALEGLADALDIPRKTHPFDNAYQSSSVLADDPPRPTGETMQPPDVSRESDGGTTSQRPSGDKDG